MAGSPKSQSRSIKTAAPTRSGRRRNASRVIVLLLTASGALTGLLSLTPAQPRLVWNHTASAPTGLYLIENRLPARGDLLAIAPRGALSTLLETEDVLPAGRVLLKPLAAAPEDIVCRNGATILVNGRALAGARDRTASGRLLPRWSGCRRLAENEIFLLSSHPDSFDGRYFGPIDRHQIVGVANPVITFPPSGTVR